MRPRNLGLCVVLVAGGCEGVDGDTPGAYGEARFRGRDFEISYISPPWRVEEATTQRLRLKIDAEVFGTQLGADTFSQVFYFEHVTASGDIEAAILDMAGVGGVPLALDTSQWTGQLNEDLTAVDLTDAPSVAFAELAFLLRDRGAELQTPVSSFAAADGRVGAMFGVVVLPGLFVRAYYFAASDSVVRAQFVSIFDLDDIDIDDMVASVTVDDAQEQVDG